MLSPGVEFTPAPLRPLAALLAIPILPSTSIAATLGGSPARRSLHPRQSRTEVHCSRIRIVQSRKVNLWRQRGCRPDDLAHLPPTVVYHFLLSTLASTQTLHRTRPLNHFTYVLLHLLVRVRTLVIARRVPYYSVAFLPRFHTATLHCYCMH